MNGITLSLMQKNEVATVATLWRNLEAQIGNSLLTASWDWIETWLTHYGDTVDYWFVIGKVQDEPVGIVLLTKEKQRPIPLTIKAYHIGAEGEPFNDMVRAVNNRILVKESEKLAFYKALLSLIMTKFSWEEIVFDNFNAKEAQQIQNIVKQLRYPFSLDIKPTLSYNFSEARTKQCTVLETLSPHTRHSIRRSLRVFNNDLTTEWAETPKQALEILDELITFYNVTWKEYGKRSVFDSQRFLNFQQAIIPKLLKQNKVILYRVKSKQYGTLGCLYILVDNGIGYGYQFGLNRFENVAFNAVNKNRLGTGFILHSLFMEDCIQRDIREYNFGEGLYPYKRKLTNTEESFVTLSIRKNPKPLIRKAIIDLHNKLNEKKQTPLALQLLSKLIKNK